MEKQREQLQKESVEKQRREDEADIGNSPRIRIENRDAAVNEDILDKKWMFEKIEDIDIAE